MLKIETIKDLEAVIKLCRKNGVSDVTIDGVKLRLDAETLPARQKRNTATDQPIDTQSVSEEDLLFWSAQHG